MAVRRVKSVTVILDDGTSHTFEGDGHLTTVGTTVGKRGRETPRGRVEVVMPLEARFGDSKSVVLPTVGFGARPLQ